MLIDKFPDRALFCRLAEKHNVIPVCAEILADTETPVALLKKIQQRKGPVFLFESVEGGERWGRYSFIGASARTHIRVFRDVVEVTENGDSRRIAHDNRPLEILKDLMKQYDAAEIPGLPRFWGGAVGYLTYEMVSFFEAIPNRLPEDKPLAHFIIPDELLVFDNIRHTMLGVIITFPQGADTAETEYRSAMDRIEALLDRMEQPLPAGPEQEEGTEFKLKPVLDEDAYREMVRKVKTEIRAGEIIQSVISQPFACEPAPDLWTLYRAQRFINPSPYLFFLHLDEMALIGSSPETMVRLENGIASLRPIAGTRPRGTSEQEDRAMADDLLQDEKERAEHLMLVDLGRNDLGRVARVGSVQVTDLMIVERYSHVMHLVSNVTCDLKTEYDAWDLIQATFPAGTLSGAPKVRAMEIIDELEDEPRGAYGGAVGYVSFSGNMDLAIIIRTACIDAGRMTVRAGAGIVADSDPEKEREETANKAMALQKALTMVQGHARLRRNKDADND